MPLRKIRLGRYATHADSTISDQQWAQISPLLLAGETAGPDERPEIRQAVDAMLWRERQSGDGFQSLPTWVTDHTFVRAIHQRWYADGTAGRIRRLAQEKSEHSRSRRTLPSPEQRPDGDSANANPTEQRHSLPPAPWRKGDHAYPKDRYHQPQPPTPGAPRTTAEMIQQFEQWIAYHYHRAHVSTDPYENDLGRHYRPAFQAVLELLYAHWEVENDAVWDKPTLYDPMPKDDWLDRTKHSQAVMIVTEGLDEAFDHMETSVDDVQRVVIKGVPQRPRDRNQRDADLINNANQVRQQLQALRHAVTGLHNVGLRSLSEAQMQETAVVRPEPDPDEPPPERPRRAKRVIKPPGEPPYEVLAIAWAKEHGGVIRARDLAEQMVADGARTPDQEKQTASSIIGAIINSYRFRKSERGVYHLVDDRDIGKERTPLPIMPWQAWNSVDKG